MRIDIELIIIVVIVLILFFWFVWFKITKKINIKKYNPENDKGRKAEEKRKEKRGRESRFGESSKSKLGARIRESSRTVISVQGFGKSEEPGVLPTAEIIVDGKTSNSNGKTSNSDGKTRRKFRNPFRRRR